MKTTSKKYLTLFFLILWVSIACAQEMFYHQREIQASALIKGNLQQLRQQSLAKQWQFQLGYTAAMDVPLTQLAGLKAPANLEQQMSQQNQFAQQLITIDDQEKAKFIQAYPGKLPELSLKPNPAASAFDWRKLGKVTPVRNQMNCGSCWAFATLGAYEGNYMIRNIGSIDASEQCILNCSGAGSCGGGWWAFNFLMSNGTASEADYPYSANDKPCLASYSAPYKAVAWGYVKASNSIPSVAELKQALCTYGPLAVAVYASPAFQAYTGGIFNEFAGGTINHGVTLIGWDDSKKAWLIKNSWGTAWGETCGYGSERGYMWISYNCNSIGYAAAWVKARSLFYRLPIHFDKLIPKYIIPIQPVKPLPLKPVQINPRTPIPKYPIQPGN